MSALVLAIDGPSGSGKSSTAKAIALRANWSYLDTGALYRAVTYLALKNKVDNEESVIEFLKNSLITFDTDPADPKVYLDGVDISSEIRLQRISDQVSAISAMASVRNILLDLQRQYISDAPIGIVVEGRDIGSVVFPDATLKVYLVATPLVRAERRVAQHGGDVAEIARAIAERDERDSTRADSPLRQTPDAVVVDTSNRSVNQIVADIRALLTQRLKSS